MASSIDIYGLILLGNSGVGKSFLANRFLNDDQAFESRFSARSVTHQTEWKQMQGLIDKRHYNVANIPGLIEADQKLVDENRQEVVKALEKYPLSTIIFVFGHRNGRISNEDLVGFHAITDAYEFDPKSLLILINGIPSDRSDDYFDQTSDFFHQLTNIDEDRIYYIEKMTCEQSKQNLHQTLHELVAQCQPNRHVKRHDIILTTDELTRLKTLYKQKQQQLLNQGQEHRQSSTEIILPETPELMETRRSMQKQQSLVEEHIQLVHDQTQQLQQQLSRQQMETMTMREPRFDAPDRNNTLQLAEQLVRDSERNRQSLDNLVLQPQTVIIGKKSSKILKPIKKAGRIIRDTFFGR